MPTVQADQTRPWRSQKHLQVNTSSAYRSVVPLGRSQGVAQLRQLCQTPTFEEIWAYVPAESVWLELGCCEGSSPRKNYVGLEKYIFRLMARYKRLEIYHIHPRTAFIRRNYGDPQKVLKTVSEALPSHEDMAAMINLSRRFWAMQPDGAITWRICSRHGTTTYGLTTQGRTKEGKIALRRFLFEVLGEEDLEENDALLSSTSPGAGHEPIDS